jgi:hypothetical protein
MPSHLGKLWIYYISFQADFQSDFKRILIFMEVIFLQRLNPPVPYSAHPAHKEFPDIRSSSASWQKADEPRCAI